MSDGLNKVMMIFAHPDDAEFSSSGTIAKWAAEGREIVYVVCTNGSKGTSDRSIAPEKLVEIRRKEQIAACKVLGVADVVFLEHEDGYLEPTPELRGELVKLIRQYRPDIVFTFDPYRLYQAHRDHRSVGEAALDAVFPAARDHLYYPEQVAEGLEPHKVAEAYLFGTDHADVFVDISATFERKLAALACHKSQIGDRMGEIEPRLRDLAETLGRQAGVPLAEAFKRLEFRR